MRSISIFLICFLFGTTYSVLDRILLKDHNYVDSFGRVRIFHGVNAVVKQHPWLPSIDHFDFHNSLSMEDAESLRSWGMNVVRLGVMWPGVEPTRGVYNYTYLAEADRLIRMLGDHGIYTIVDFHQDVLSEYACGEGVPTFAFRPTDTKCGSLSKLVHCKSIADYNMTKDPSTGFPLASECKKHAFGEYYSTPEVASAFESLYTDPELIDMFSKYWAEMAKQFVNNPFVLGYNLINEPSTGNIWKKSGQMVPGTVEKKLILPFYIKVCNKIREIDNDTIIMYEGTQFPASLGSEIFPLGFSTSPEGEAYSNKQALSYHVYCCFRGIGVHCDSKGNPSDQDSNGCTKYNNKKVSTRIKDATRLGGGNFMTEFGACTSGSGCVGEITRSTSAADKYISSWAYWQYKFYHDKTTQSGEEEGFYSNGVLIHDKVKALSRTYATATQGIPSMMQFSSITGNFLLKYIGNPSLTEPTEVFFSEEFYYANGFDVSVRIDDLDSSVKWQQAEHNRLNIWVFSNTQPHIEFILTALFPSTSPQQGEYITAKKDILAWSIDTTTDILLPQLSGLIDRNTVSNGKIGITMSTALTVKEWKQVKIYDDRNINICNMELKSGHHNAISCDNLESDNFVDGYRFELWKKMTLGNQHIDTITSDYFGPLKDYQVSFVWATE